MSDHWIQLSDGTSCEFDDPFCSQISNVPSIEVISHSLAQINRFTGHASRPYSVAEHSLLVEELARADGRTDPKFLLYCLMHDAHECMFGDISSPLKSMLGDEARILERKLEVVTLSAFEIVPSDEDRKACKYYDLMALANEKRDLMKAGLRPWFLDTIGIPGTHFQDLSTYARTYASWYSWAYEFQTRFHYLKALSAG